MLAREMWGRTENFERDRQQLDQYFMTESMKVQVLDVFDCLMSIRYILQKEKNKEFRIFSGCVLFCSDTVTNVYLRIVTLSKYHAYNYGFG